MTIYLYHMYSTRLPFSLQLASTYLLQRAKIEQYISRRAQRNIFIAAAAAADNPNGFYLRVLI